MQLFTCPMHPNVQQDKEGLCLDCGMNLVPMKTKAHKETTKMYTCPMHPEVMKSAPGMCPECGMNLLPASAKASSFAKVSEDTSVGHDTHKGHLTNIFKVKFWVSLILSVPVVAYSDIVQKLLDYTAPVFPGSQYLSFVLASFIFFYGGWVFLASAYRELKAKMPGMMTLIALAILTAYIYSVFVTFTGGDKTLYWELATLITVMLLGHWVEMRAVTGAQSALKELSKLLPDKAERLQNKDSDQTDTVTLEELNVDDYVLVKPGGKIPSDGIVYDGQSDVNESIATGESKPVAKQSGSEVIAGTVNGDGALKIRVTKIGEHTFLAGVMRLVSEAQASKSRLQLLSDRAAFYLTIVAVVTGAITLAGWLAVAEPSFAIERMVAVLVIACPHALGLAIPLVASISTTKAAQNGFLVKQRLALEAARGINTVLFDKTGTLTKGEFGVNQIVTAPGTNEERVLTLAASVNSQSEHPIAKAIVDEARKRKITTMEVKGFARLPGKGAKGTIDNKVIFVGSPSLLEDLQTKPDDMVAKRSDELSKQGMTVIYVSEGKHVLGSIALGDVIREESREAITQLKTVGVKVAMVTGDSEDVASWVAKELELDEYFAKVLPNEKSDKVKLLQSKGEKVAMVGDGVNDAPALTQADLGIAIGAGTNVAIESAGIILVKNDPRDIVKIIRLSKLTYVKMIQNLFWAAGYNVIAIPLAAGVLAAWGIWMQPALAALFMSISTVIVALNAVLLKRKSLTV